MKPLTGVDKVIHDYVRAEATRLEWNLSQTAHAIGVDRRTLYRWLKGWGIDARAERSKLYVLACAQCGASIDAVSVDGGGAVFADEVST